MLVETILVTGATGTVGSEVTKQLSSASANLNIKAAGHSIESIRKDVKSDRVEPIRIDYSKPETLQEALKNVDKVFLLTPFQSDMVELSSILIKKIENSGSIKHVVKLSVIGADAELGTGGRLHRQVEKMIEDSGISYTFLRPNTFMQNFVNFFSQPIKEQGAFYLTAGEGKVSFVDVRDIAAVAVQTLINNKDGRYNGKAYTVTGPEAISYEDAAKILSEQVRKKISYVNISEGDARKGMKDIGWDEFVINYVIELPRAMKMGYLSPVTTVVEEVTGKKATSFSQFAKDYAESFR